VNCSRRSRTVTVLQKRAGLLPEEVMGHVGVTIGNKSTAVVMAALPRNFPLPTFARVLGYLGESYFLSKKVAKRYNQL
jgi:hypothetical protein